MITVLLADDHGVLRDALQYLLEAQGDIHVVATAENGQQAVDKAEGLCPDIAVLDISMPQMDGLKAARAICQRCPVTRVVMLTIYNTRKHVEEALKAGARGYVLKDAAGKELVEAIRTVHGGGQYFSKKISNADE